ncbi:hypothetical protein L8P38_20845, partial [Enterobacter kobei]|nr:hypothetical protein [Enterobacter kobei]
MKKNFKFSVVSIAVSLFMANQAGAANTWTESRSDAMGGTGVAAGSYGSGALMNPLMILVKIIKLRWIHILSYDQMVSRK